MSLILSGTDGLSDVDGSAATPAIRGTDANTGIFFPAADTIAFSEGGAEAMRITSAGNLGVNTTTPATEGANAKIAIVGAAAQNASTLATSNSQAAFTIRADANSGYCMNFGNLVTSGFPYLQGAVFNGGSSSSDIAFNPFGGNVGIGTASPNAKLTVKAGTNQSLYIGTAASIANSVVIGTVNDALSANIPLEFRYGTTAAFLNGGNEAMRLDNSNNLVVGTTSASGNGTILTLKHPSNATVWGTGPNSNGTFLVYNASGVGVYLGSGATSWSSSSDERTKTTIVPFENALEKVCTLRAGTGRYLKDEETVSRSFLIAQDVQAVLPEAVNIQDDEIGTLGLQYTDVIPLLVAAIKEQQALILSLTARITALETP